MSDTTDLFLITGYTTATRASFESQAALRGASLDQRARRLIAIAHPDHRDELQFNARKAGLLH